MKQYISEVTVWDWVIVIIILFSFMPSCLTVNKALVKVLGSDSATNVILRLHPCAIAKDSVVRQSDTVTSHDTTVQTLFYTDTLHHLKHDTTTVKITNTKTIHDTINHYQLNQRDIDIANSTLLISTKKIASLQQNIVDKDAEIKARDKWLWLFIGAIVAFCLSNAFWIWNKFK